MPLYEYQCQSCEEKLETIQKFSDPLLTVCPQCGGSLKKLISSPAIQFKGSGFYITDYGKSGSNKASSSKSDSGESKKTDSGNSSKSEARKSSKPAGDKTS